MLSSDFRKSNRMRQYWSLVVGLLLIASSSLPLRAQEEPSLYIVGPNDTLAITVYEQPQLSGKFMVQSDGTFAFPLLGRVKVGGLSVQAIENEMRDRLTKGYLKNPQLSVVVETYRSQQIFVIGEVKQPGGLQFTGTMTMVEALARVGSVTENAGSEALIVRQSPGAQPPDAATLKRVQESKDDNNVIRVNLQTLQTGSLSENITLRGGDTIFIPRGESVFISGHVGTPGAYGVRKGMTVRQALALAGGVTDRGSTRRIQIVRKVDGKERTIDVDLQQLVQPCDTIVLSFLFL
jgi:polysaccharide export outer membrane protein